MKIRLDKVSMIDVENTMDGHGDMIVLLFNGAKIVIEDDVRISVEDISGILWLSIDTLAE